MVLSLIMTIENNHSTAYNKVRGFLSYVKSLNNYEADCMTFQQSHGLVGVPGTDLRDGVDDVDVGLTSLRSVDGIAAITSEAAAISVPNPCHNGRKMRHHDTLRTEHNFSSKVDRLATFKNWPRESKMNPSALARAGFFYTGYGDMVKCFSCNGEIEGWEFGNSAIGKHKRFFPKCQFAREKGIQDLSNQEKSGGPPEYRPSDRLASEYLRVLTFLSQKHTSPCPIRAQALARAGFYYVQTRNRVRCFVCTGEISNWKCVDNPLVQHKNMFSGCPFVRGEDVGNEKMTSINIMNIQQALIYREPATKLPLQQSSLLNHVGELRQTATLTDQWPYLVRAQNHPLYIDSSFHSKEMGALFYLDSSFHSKEMGALFYLGGTDIQPYRYIYFPQEIGIQAWQPYYPQRFFANGGRVLQRLVLSPPRYMKVVSQSIFPWREIWSIKSALCT